MKLNSLGHNFKRVSALYIYCKKIVLLYMSYSSISQ